MEGLHSAPELQAPEDDRRDRDPREPFQPPKEEDPEEPFDPRDEPVDDPGDAPGRGEPERRDPGPDPPARHVGSRGEVLS